jgi:hypothetical protein
VIVVDVALLVAVDVIEDGVVGIVRSHGQCLARRHPARGIKPAAPRQRSRLGWASS